MTVAFPAPFLRSTSALYYGEEGDEESSQGGRCSPQKGHEGDEGKEGIEGIDVSARGSPQRLFQLQSTVFLHVLAF